MSDDDDAPVYPLLGYGTGVTDGAVVLGDLYTSVTQSDCAPQHFRATGFMRRTEHSGWQHLIASTRRLILRLAKVGAAALQTTHEHDRCKGSRVVPVDHLYCTVAQIETHDGAAVSH